MTIYRTRDGELVDTGLATEEWNDATYVSNGNSIHVTTDSQWEWEKLYLSRKGIYYIEEDGATRARGEVRIVTREEAAAWLLFNEHELPEDLAEFEDIVL